MSKLNQENGQPFIKIDLDAPFLANYGADNVNGHWLNFIEQQSKLLMALLEPETFHVTYANPAFCEITGMSLLANNSSEQKIPIQNLFNNFNSLFIEQLYRRHLLPLVLRDIYGIKHSQWRFLDEPIIATVHHPENQETYYIHFWLRSQHLQVERINANIDEFAQVDLAKFSPEEIVLQPHWEKQLKVKNYRLHGHWLWEGLEITNQERIQRLINLLLERDSMLQPKKYLRLIKQMRSLFRAEDGLLLSVKREQVHLYKSKNGRVEQTTFSSLESLQNSHFWQAAQTNTVLTVTDLRENCSNQFEQSLLQEGVNSLLLIPLMATPQAENLSQQLMGLVGMMSFHSHHFDQLDISHANALIPALRVALRQATQVQFSHIHPSVEWRFLQEAERRSWGLPPTSIVFQEVYPMYGISDIRGSSQERNRAVQEDLLTQFRLALTVIQTVCQHQNIPFLEQLELDLQARLEKLKQEIIVEDEVTAIQYLREHLEIYFDYFKQCGSEAIQAIEAYEKACDNPHHCVYIAREYYDQMIYEINQRLRQTWEKWQNKMQAIIPHYCDVEITDGIDHMIYAGTSINSGFSRFHLHALRYEQLRAVCDCARTSFSFRDDYQTTIEVTHLVLVQDISLDIFHDEQTEKLFDVKGSKDTRYEIVKKRIDKGTDAQTHTRITQPGMLTIVYSTEDEGDEYRQYLRYLAREGWINGKIETGTIEPLQGVTGLKFVRVQILAN